MKVLALSFPAMALALVAACGSDESGGSEFGSGGSGGATTGGGGSVGIGGSGGSGGSAGSASGGSAGAATGGSAGAASGGSAGAATGGAAGASGTCGGYGQTTECQDCLKQHCCAEGTACAASTDCAGLVVCARQCPAPTDTGSQCVQDCAGQFNLGGNAYNPLILCMGTSCGTVCGYL